MNFTDLDNDFKYLYNCNFFADEFDPDGHEEHLDFARAFLEHYL